MRTLSILRPIYWPNYYIRLMYYIMTYAIRVDCDIKTGNVQIQCGGTIREIKTVDGYNTFKLSSIVCSGADTIEQYPLPCYNRIKRSYRKRQTNKQDKTIQDVGQDIMQSTNKQHEMDCISAKRLFSDNEDN